MLKTPSEATRDVGLLLMRLGLGAMFMYYHGWGKITGGPERWEGLGEAVGLPVPVVFGFLAALAEFGGGLLLFIGLLTRPAALLMMLTMLGAAWSHYIDGERFLWPLELSFVFLALCFLGPGRFSLDATLFGKRSTKKR